MSAGEKVMLGLAVIGLIVLIALAVVILRDDSEKGSCCPNEPHGKLDCRFDNKNKSDCEKSAHCHWNKNGCPSGPGPHPHPGPHKKGACCGINDQAQGSCAVNIDKDSCVANDGKCKWEENGCQ